MRKRKVLTHHIPEGHGRFSCERDKDGSWLMICYYADDHAEPGAYCAARDTSKEVPVLAIRLTHPGSARAWSKCFAMLADMMEASAKEANQ